MLATFMYIVKSIAIFNVHIYIYTHINTNMLDTENRRTCYTVNSILCKKKNIFHIWHICKCNRTLNDLTSVNSDGLHCTWWGRYPCPGLWRSRSRPAHPSERLPEPPWWCRSEGWRWEARPHPTHWPARWFDPGKSRDPRNEGPRVCSQPPRPHYESACSQSLEAEMKETFRNYKDTHSTASKDFTVIVQTSSFSLCFTSLFAVRSGVILIK